MRTGNSGGGVGRVEGRTWKGIEKTLSLRGVPFDESAAENKAMDMV